MNADVSFPDGDPSPFQVTAVNRITHVLREHEIPFTDFQLNLGAKRAFWTSFMLGGEEHVLAVYPDELNIVTGSMIYENYLRREFRSKESLLESFVQRLTRLIREGIWELPEEDRA